MPIPPTVVILFVFLTGSAEAPLFGQRQLPNQEFVKECRPCRFSVSPRLAPYSIFFELKDKNVVRAIRVVSPGTSGTEQVLAVSDLEGSMRLRDEGFVVRSDDINFDGYADLFLMTGYGYGGVNIWGDYWVFQPGSRRFMYLGSFAQFEVEPKRKRLRTFVKHSLAEWTENQYRWSKGRPVIVKTVEQVSSNGGGGSSVLEVVTTERKGNRIVVTKRERVKEDP